MGDENKKTNINKPKDQQPKTLQDILNKAQNFKSNVNKKLIQIGTDGDDIMFRIPEDDGAFIDHDEKDKEKKRVHKQYIMDGLKGSDNYFIFPEINYSIVIRDSVKSKGSIDIDKLYVVFFENTKSTIKISKSLQETTIQISNAKVEGLKESFIRFTTGSMNMITMLCLDNKKKFPDLKNIEKYKYDDLIHYLKFNFDKKHYESFTDKKTIELYKLHKKNLRVTEMNK